MAYELAIRQEPGYLHIRVTGDNTAESVRGYLNDVRTACIDRNCPSVLVEEDLQGPGLGVGEIFHIIELASQNVWPHVQRIAYVDVNPAHSQLNMRFAEVVATNRGVNVRVFGRLDDAQEWISRQIA
jgi:hypothetical protein